MFSLKIREKPLNRTKHLYMWPLLLAVIVLLTAAPGAWAIQYSETKIIIEVNSTDGDAGIQIFLDGEGTPRGT